ncbi:hypothetical protein IJ22_17930 [Paenibacillus naphthalenovorans]|uniref:Uncharacterized protein n=1 Tax=Paenibacillus naphthalenovorans TaxID=162209 RepID=A0A0U2VRP1_9BACL|nr:hypothetical protein IJ22_17930 [Paenibacillus naphthalenovorans]
MSKSIGLFTKEMLDKAKFDWCNLNGKSLLIRVIEQDGWRFVYGMESNKLYLLDHKLLK